MTARLSCNFYFLGAVTESISDSTYCDMLLHVVLGLSMCMYVWPSVTLVHPAKAVGWSEMPFGREHWCGPK